MYLAGLNVLGSFDSKWNPDSLVGFY